MKDLPEARKERQRVWREAMREEGFVQVPCWVPDSHRHQLRRIAEDMRDDPAGVWVKRTGKRELLPVTNDGNPIQRRAEPRYQNPDDPAETWTGRGRIPGWVLKFRDNGGDLETLSIEGA